MKREKRLKIASRVFISREYSHGNFHDMETCKVSYIWTKEEVRRAALARSQWNVRPGLLIFIRCFAFLLGAAMLFLIIVGSPFDFMAGIFLLLCAYCAIIGDKGGLILSLRKFEKSPHANKTVQREFSQQQISIQWEDLSAAQFSWQLVRYITVARDGLFINLRRTSLWLPYDAFETPQCIEKVKEFARSNDVKIIEAKR